ncbi:MAG: hypothetical protein C7B46_15000 [Sulfobacillus benefaciens]|uniref:Uncharacterized protein n=1 Tax=Sulfobacillus benefaciens TaxID=453960 RepID=A0A2T2XCV6_9FIRM|nr:MAG: hypothetical protein C7B46_15000 [Sulfobacillus benefaciens]
MSSTLKQHNTPPSRKGRRRSPDSTQRLITLAQTVAAEPDTADLSATEERLIALVLRLVTQGSDRKIWQALTTLESRHAHKAADCVTFWAEDAASTIELLMMPDASVDAEHAATPPDPVPGEATAFLVPVIFFTPPGTSLPLTVPLGHTLDALAHSFRQHGLLGAEPSLVLFPGLYRLADLPDTWSERRRWLQILCAHVTRQTANPIPLASPDPEAEPEEAPATTLRLRFLVGAVLRAGGEDSTTPAGPLWDTETPLFASDAAQVAALTAWQHTVTALLERTMKTVSVWPGFPDLWSEALDAGVDWWNHVVVESAFTTYCAQRGVAPDAVLADIRWNADASAWQGAFLTMADTGPSWFWVGWGDPADQRDALLEALRSLGIRRIALDEQGCEG